MSQVRAQNNSSMSYAQSVMLETLMRPAADHEKLDLLTAFIFSDFVPLPQYLRDLVCAHLLCTDLQPGKMHRIVRNLFCMEDSINSRYAACCIEAISRLSEYEISKIDSHLRRLQSA